MRLTFYLGPPEIIKLWTLVAQIYLSDNSKLMGSSASGCFGPQKFWTVYLLGHQTYFGSVQHCIRESHETWAMHTS